MSITLVLCGLAMATHLGLGLLVLFRAPGKPLNQLFSLLLLLFFAWACGEMLIIWRGIESFSLTIMLTPALLLPYFFGLFTTVFPFQLKDSLLSNRRNRLLAAIPTLFLLGTLWSGALITHWESFSNGIAIHLGRLEFVAKGIVIAYLLLALKNLSIAGKRIETTLQQQRLRYTVIAFMLPVAAGSVYMALGKWYLGLPTVYTLGLFPTLGIAMAALLTYAILRFRLIEIDIIFSIGLVYTILTALLIGVIEVIQELVQNWFDASDLASTIVSTLVLAVFFSPLKDFATNLVDRFFGHRKFEAAPVIRRVLQKMRQASSPPDVLHNFLDEVRTVIDFQFAVARLTDGVTSGVPITREGFAADILLPLPATCFEFTDIDLILEQENTTVIAADLAIYRQWRTHEYRLVLPIRDENKTVIGVVFMGAKGNRLPFSKAELSLLTSLVAEISPILANLSLVNALVAKDRCLREISWAYQIYSRLQTDLTTSTFGGFHICLFSSLAQQIKGDLIDLYENVDGDKGCFLALCDAFHQGIPAALTLHTIFTALRAAPANQRLQHAHDILTHFHEPPLRSAITLLSLSDPAAERIIINNAGNPAPVLIKPDASLTGLLPQGIPLGIEGALPVAETSVCLAPGDLLFCCTNGLEKAFSTPAQLLAEIRQQASHGMAACHKMLQEHLTALPDRAEFPDDITYLFLERRSNHAAAATAAATDHPPA